MTDVCARRGRERNRVILVDTSAVAGTILGARAVSYLSLVPATILGFAICGDLPAPKLLLSSRSVIAPGVYILWRLRNSVIADSRLKLHF